MMRPQPPPTEEEYDKLLYGTDDKPLLVSLQSIRGGKNFRALVRVGYGAYWFQPRHGTKWNKKELPEKRRPESSVDSSEASCSHSAASSSADTSSMSSIRLECINRKNCKAKIFLFASNTDIVHADFFAQEFKVSSWENFETHVQSCALPDGWGSLAESYISQYNRLNRVGIIKKSQSDVRKFLIKTLKISDQRAASLFSEKKMHLLSNSACRFEGKLKKNNPTSGILPKLIPDYLQNL